MAENGIPVTRKEEQNGNGILFRSQTAESIFVSASVQTSFTTSLPGNGSTLNAGPLVGTGGSTPRNVSGRINALRVFGSSVTTGDINAGATSAAKFLVQSASLGLSNKFTEERFTREDFRLISGSYDAQSDVTGS